jgi:hypothetical protein
VPGPAPDRCTVGTHTVASSALYATVVGAMPLSIIVRHSLSAVAGLLEPLHDDIAAVYATTPTGQPLCISLCVARMQTLQTYCNQRHSKVSQAALYAIHYSWHLQTVSTSKEGH